MRARWPAPVLRGLNLTASLLVVLLQRTPVLRALTGSAGSVTAAPTGALVQAAFATVAGLGAVDSLAGASAHLQLLATSVIPARGTVGQPFTLGIYISGGNVGESWTVTNNLPPGITPQGAAVLLGNLWVINQSVAGTLVLSGTPTTAGTYSFSIEGWQFPNRAGPATAGTATIIVSSAASSAPAITAQPLNQNITVGAAATFSVTATGSPAPSYQWRKNGTAIAEATGASLPLSNVQPADAGTYSVYVANSAGNVTSNGAVLTVLAVPPTITAQPQARTLAVGSTVVFSVEAAGAGLTYQWKKNNAFLTGATAARLILANVQAADAANYTVTVTNSGGGSVTSTTAALTIVTSTDPGRLVNLSIRGTSGMGNKVLIMGFVTGPTTLIGATTLLLRGSGETLVSYDVADAIADPIIQVIPSGSSTPLATNDNWGGTPELKAAAAATGAFAFLNDSSKDSAILANIPRERYSVIVSGNNATTGPVLAEIYDANLAGTYNPTTPRLVNISARAYAGGADNLIAGFVILGSTAKTVLIRAIGPDHAFAQYFAAGQVLGDPRLDVYRTQSGVSTLIFSNDNWGGDAQLTNLGLSLGAFALESATGKDAIVLTTLDPGVYSAQVVPANGTAGITLIEVYEVP